MIHVSGHDIAAYCAGRAQHDDDRCQLVLCETERDRHGKEKGFKAYELKKSTGGSCPDSSEGLTEIQACPHCHQSQRSGDPTEVVNGTIQKNRHRKGKKGPDHTGKDAEDDGISKDFFSCGDKSLPVERFLTRLKKGKDSDCHDIIKGNAGNDHERRHSCVSVKILDNGNAKDRGAASVGGLDEFSLNVPGLQKKRKTCGDHNGDQGCEKAEENHFCIPG